MERGNGQHAPSRKPIDRDGRPRPSGRVARRPSLELLESRALFSALPRSPAAARSSAAEVRVQQATAEPPVLSAADVEILLDRAEAATASDDAIIAVVDRNGNVLGIRLESGLDPAILNPTTPEQVATRVFAIDGAIAKARTAAFFSNDTAPLTSRTVQNLSETTMIQRVVESNPNIPDLDSTLRGPGFVAPVGIKGHFPAGINFTPQVDLFAIEHTNRDSILHPGPDAIRQGGAGDDVLLPQRFNIDPKYVPPGQSIPAPESYGLLSGELPTAQSRGIATLPGGIPLYKAGPKVSARPRSPVQVGGIGVFFPGTTGFATEENSNINEGPFYDSSKPDRSQEAEFIAFVAGGGAPGLGLNLRGAIGTVPALPPGFIGLNANEKAGRIDLVGISLDIVGGHGLNGPSNLLAAARNFPGTFNGPVTGANAPLQQLGPDGLPDGTPLPGGLQAGKSVPTGFLVVPHASADGSLTAEDVERIIQRSIAEANRTRAAIRLPLDNTARMMIAVTDNTGEVLGLFRMPDATFFSIDVAVSKARNVAYYANPEELQEIDRIPGVPAGTAFTNRTFRYVSLPRFPEGIDGYPPGPFSILNDDNANPQNGALNGPALPASAFQSVQGHDAFNPQTNFRDPFNILNQSGIVFFPGSSALYKDLDGDGKRELVGGFGISGDGVDQDDVVTFAGKAGLDPNDVLRADQVKVRDVRLPYQKFNRQPHAPFPARLQPEPEITSLVSPDEVTPLVPTAATAAAARRARVQAHAAQLAVVRKARR